jgi:hypothetical protein
MSNLREVAYGSIRRCECTTFLGLNPQNGTRILRAPRGASILATARQHDRHVGQNNSAGVVPERPSESRALFEDRPTWHHRAHSIMLDAS